MTCSSGLHNSNDNVPMQVYKPKQSIWVPDPLLIIFDVISSIQINEYIRQSPTKLEFVEYLGRFSKSLKWLTSFASTAINSKRRKTEKEILHCTIMGKGNDAAASHESFFRNCSTT